MMENPFDWHEYTIEDRDGFIPIEQWGKDHWSTFAYLEICAVDAKGIIDNRRMRCNPRVHREFATLYRERGTSGDAIGYPTRLKDGICDQHDDWSCLEDMVASGLLRAFSRVITTVYLFGDSEGRIEFTQRGFVIAADLRAYKAKGGNFATFEPAILAEEPV